MYVHTCYACGEGIYPGQEYKRSGKNKLHKNPDCAHARAVCGRPLIVSEGGTRFYSNSRPRLIASRVCKSQIIRTCIYCENYDQSLIFPGDEYVREVWRLNIGEIWESTSCIMVRFRHFPDCPFPFDDYDEDFDSGSVIVMKKKANLRASGAPLRRAA